MSRYRVTLALLFLLAACARPRPAAIAPKGAASADAPTVAPGSRPVAAAAKGGAAPAWSDADSPVPVDANDPTWGERSAPVTIVMFSDFQCPFCSRVEATLEQVKRAYGPAKVRIVWKNEPLSFHPNAKPAAEAAQGVFELAGVEAFWRFHDAALQHQESLGTDSYLKWAEEAGVRDLARYRAGLDAHAFAGKVDEDVALAEKVGANGTPFFFLNGVELSGAQPFDRFREIIDAQLASAAAARAAGTSAERVYVELSKKNKGAAPAPPEREADDEDVTVWRVPVGDAPTRGPATALVTIVEFSDFQCPFCKRVEGTLQRVLEAYGDDVRLVWRHQPLAFHPRAEPAAELTEVARKEKGDVKGFWAAHDAIFARHPALEDDDLAAIGRDLGLDAARVRRALATHEFHARIERDADLADALDAGGTPHFFVNGRRLVGAQPFERFKALMDEELAKARALVASGTPAARVYDETMKGAKEPPPPETKSVAAPGASSPFRGGARARVVVQEFADYQCPYCGRVEATLKRVLDTYGDRVKLVWRHKPLPMHPDAQLAAEASAEALRQKGNAGFWRLHALLLEHQGAPGGLARPALERYAGEAGLDLPKFRDALDQGRHKAAVAADAKASDDAGITGTPAFVINGYYLSGAQPYARFKRLIDRALREAGAR